MSLLNRRNIAAGLISCILIFSVQPACAQSMSASSLAEVSVTSPLRHEYSLAPGGTRTGGIRLTNSANQAALVSITPADIIFLEDGSTQVQPAGTNPASNSAWIRVPAQVEVPANSSLEVPFTVRTPTEPDVHGSYWSILQLEALRPSVIRSEAAEEQVLTKVQITFQYSVAVVTHVGIPAQSKLQFTQPAFASDGSGGYLLQIELHNPGDFVVEADTWLELYDSHGVLVKRLDGDQARAYPGAVDRILFDLGELANETYQAVVIADAGGNSVFGARYNLSTE